MANPPIQLSTFTGLTLVDTQVNPGSIELPPTASQVGRIITFKDKHASFSVNPLTLQCVGSDRFENGE